MTADEEISLRLLVDTKWNKVLFAEANHEFVDITFSLLTLPMGIMVKLMPASAVHGSIDRLYQSVQDIDDCYFKPSIDKIDLLFPMVMDAGGEFVEETEAYIVTDGLEVTPVSAISTIALMNRFVLNKDVELAEKVVYIGMDEQFQDLLKAVIRSDTVLSDLFLANKE